MSNPGVTELAAGAVHTPGFGYTAEAAADLERLSLAGLGRTVDATDVWS